MQLSQFFPALPFEQQQVSNAFKALHQQHVERHDQWSLSASRSKILVTYWLEIFTRHFFPLWIAGLVMVFLLSPASLSMVFPACVAAGAAVFLCLLPTLYIPYYYIEFIPLLENCLEEYRQQYLDGIQKCKKEQYPVLTLLLIEHVSEELMDCPQATISDLYINLLSRKYGVSRKMVDSVLRIVKHRQWDRKKIRKRTEIMEAFAMATDHFDQQGNRKATRILELLEQKILS